MALTKPGTLGVLDIASGDEILRHNGNMSFTDCVFDWNGTHVVAAGVKDFANTSQLISWDYVSGSIEAAQPVDSWTYCLARNPNNSTIIGTQGNALVKVYDSKDITTPPKVYTGHGTRQRVTSVAFFPNGEQFVTGSLQELGIHFYPSPYPGNSQIKFWKTK